MKKTPNAINLISMIGYKDSITFLVDIAMSPVLFVIIFKVEKESKIYRGARSQRNVKSQLPC